MSSHIFQQEISQYNKEEADQIRKEMRQMQKDHQEQQMKLIQKMEEQL